jgi:hypothetical protein
VIFNTGVSEVRLPLGRRYEALLASSAEVACEAEYLDLPAGSVAILKEL